MGEINKKDGFEKTVTFVGGGGTEEGDGSGEAPLGRELEVVPTIHIPCCLGDLAVFDALMSLYPATMHRQVRERVYGLDVDVHI